ncbi:Transposase, Tc1-like,Ribonuclease H-like domain [Cinara cedri]|uniref:Transposase, Tc1-like,Ribonuclease H-like domain n=1 Tax=Cinara cedri TaxID=506608 RepID=A0A5E4MDF1_9HEMI|nr:Transposase, Tc1-like,Ribonuclease H-like domain [Cinara cedri]
MDRDDRFIVSTSLRNRFSNAVELQQQLRAARSTTVSTSTVRRLGEQKIVARRPATGPKLTAQHRKERLCSFLEETVEYGGGSCMFWGGISIDSKTELVCVSRTGGARVQGSLTSDRYITEILEEHVVPYAGFVGDGFILMHDNARSHTALIVKNYTEEVGIPVMNWPARSPDLNPIEHLWDELKRRVRSHDPAPTTLQDLQYAVVAEWVNIPQERIVRLITSMKDRMEAVIKARGSSTRF